MSRQWPVAGRRVDFRSLLRYSHPMPLSAPFPAAHSGEPVNWPQYVLEELAGIEGDARIDLLRRWARRLGYSADTPELLRSERGLEFREDDGGARGRFPVRYAYEKESERRFGSEAAYWCGYDPLFSGVIVGCGWVKGEPLAESYNNLGPLSGSAGVEYRCRVCRELIGRDEQILS